MKDANGNSYNRTTWVIQRRLMMQKWADYLDDLRLSSGQAERFVALGQEMQVLSDQPSNGG